ncbi:MAG: hypothetical protein PHN49_00190 [Candidatus Omnitrophica bacterium]|nr:hypothetical protein [Candidatus Omnitrophota bacterium]
MPQKVNFKKLFEQPERFLNEAQRFASTRFSDQNGFHIYGELRLSLSLSASEDTKNAVQYLKIIQAFAVAANACGKAIGAEILEVQGERIHLLMPTELSEKSVNDVLSFCITLSDIMYERIAPLAGNDWQGFAIALDHGRAILIGDGNGANGSVVSLGRCANEPAKRLNVATLAGKLSIRSRFVKHLGLGDLNVEWYSLDLRNPPATIRPLHLAFQKAPLYEAVAKEFGSDQFRKMPEIRLANTQYFEKTMKSRVTTPLKIQGFYFRADLDGFSAEVEQAFSSGEAGISSLVERFLQLMSYAEIYAVSLGRQVIRLPWAGDCANLVILPKSDEKYGDLQRTAPPLAASKWHDQKQGFILPTEKRWADFMGKSEWVIGCAGGNATEGSNGYLLIAPIATSGREFLIAAGWGARRSLDAQAIDGNQGGDTIIPKVDHQELDSPYQKLFDSIKGAPSFYRTKKKLSMKQIMDEASNRDRKTEMVKASGTQFVLPSAKPHYF